MKKFGKIVLVNLVVILLFILVVELVMHRRAKIIAGKIVTTGQDFIVCTEEFVDVPHPLLGFYYLPGTYDCVLNTRPFTMTMLPDTSRNTGYVPDPNCPDPMKIFMFGCSYTWGHGLNDDETMAYKVQQQLDCAHVKNYGIGAGSTVQSYVLLKSLIDRGDVPDMVIVNYGSIHDERNAFTGYWQKMWEYMLLNNRTGKGRLHYGKMEIPYASANSPKEVYVKRYPVWKVVRNVPLSGTSYLLNWYHKTKLQSQLDNNTMPDLHPKEKQALSVQMLIKLRELCNEFGIHFIVTGIYQDKATMEVLDQMPENGIYAIDISVDILQEGFNLEPDDSHPNGAANTLYAQHLIDYLNTSGLVHSKEAASDSTNAIAQ